MPLIGLLENVYGILTVKEEALGLCMHIFSSNRFLVLTCQVDAEMTKIKKKYFVCILKVDAAHLGDPVHRRRVYFILIRRC